MDIHKNARLTPRSRPEPVRRVLEEGQRPGAVAETFGVRQRTVRKWVDELDGRRLVLGISFTIPG